MSPQIKKLLKYALFKALIVTLLFAFLYKMENIEIVGDRFEDRVFDIINKIFSMQFKNYVFCFCYNFCKIKILGT